MTTIEWEDDTDTLREENQIKEKKEIKQEELIEEKSNYTDNEETPKPRLRKGTSSHVSLETYNDKSFNIIKTISNFVGIGVVVCVGWVVLKTIFAIETLDMTASNSSTSVERVISDIVILPIFSIIIIIIPVIIIIFILKTSGIWWGDN